MKIGRFPRLFYIDDPSQVLDLYDFPKFLISKVQILFLSHVAPLRKKGVPINWNLLSFGFFHSLQESHARQANALVEQFLICGICQPVSFLPSPLVLATVPAQEL